MYYEDLELSWRGREKGWRYRYVPDSVVRHAHSATAIQGSRLAVFYNERNRLLVLARHRSFGTALRWAARMLLATFSYFKRDVLARRTGERDASLVRLRLEALVAFMRVSWGERKGVSLRQRASR